MRILGTAAVVLAVLLCGCFEKETQIPLTGKVTVAVPSVHYPGFWSETPRSAPIIEFRTVEQYSACSQLSYSMRERHPGQISIVLGHVLRRDVPCVASMEHVVVFVAADSAASHYVLSIALRDDIDSYEIEIAADRIRLIPRELHNTVPLDTVWMR